MIINTGIPKLNTEMVAVTLGGIKGITQDANKKKAASELKKKQDFIYKGKVFHESFFPCLNSKFFSSWFKESYPDLLILSKTVSICC